MAYAMFTSLKLSLTNQIFVMQQRLNNIMEQRQNLLEFSANIADGAVTVEELASDPGNLQSYLDYTESYKAWTETADEDGGAGTTISTIQGEADATGSDMTSYAVAEILSTTVSQEYARMYQKQIDARDHELDMEQQKIQSKLTALEKHLEQVEQAEAKAIDRATPKYDGVG